MVHAMLTYRAEQRLGKAAVAAAADYQQVCSTGSVQQHLRRVPVPDDWRDADRTVGVYDRANAVVQCDVREPAKVRLFKDGNRPNRHIAYHDRVMPRDDRVDRRSSQLSLSNRPDQRLLRRLRAVYADDDAVTVACGGAHATPPLSCANAIRLSLPRMTIVEAAVSRGQSNTRQRLLDSSDPVLVPLNVGVELAACCPEKAGPVNFRCLRTEQRGGVVRGPARPRLASLAE